MTDVGTLRWVAKKTARIGLAMTIGLPQSILRCRQVRALTYHDFADARRDPFALSPAMFRRQVAWLKDAGLALSLDELVDGLRRQRSLRPGALITIDDGLATTLEVAAPILAEHGVPAIAFITPTRVGTSEPGGAGRFLNWNEARQLSDHGIAIGAHGWSHVSMACLSPSEIEQQARRSRQDLEEKLGRQVTAFAYPFGTRADYSTATRRALAEAGYDIAFTSQHGAIGLQSDLLELPRIKVESGEGMATFVAAVAGGLDGWSLVDRWMWRLQSTERRS